MRPPHRFSIEVHFPKRALGRGGRPFDFRSEHVALTLLFTPLDTRLR